MSHPLEEIMCCLGPSLAGNPTQYVMEKSFQQLGLDARFLTLQVAADDLGDAVCGMQAMGFRGALITGSFKREIVRLLDHLSDEAALIGTVNCVHRDSQDVLVGENTEGKGFCQSLANSFDYKGKNIVILGAGSAARAIAVELAGGGAGEIAIVNRTAERGVQLVDLLVEKLKVSAKFCPWDGDFELSSETDLVVNATSIGDADPSQLVPLAIDSLAPEMVVADVVLGSPATAFLRAGEARGCQRIHGQRMMVEQLFWCVQFWTGTDPDREVMRESLEEYLEL